LPAPGGGPANATEPWGALEQALRRAEPDSSIGLFVEEGAPMAAMLATLLGATPARQRATWRGVSLDYLRALLAASTVHSLWGHLVKA
jgi:hypothetical protein